MNGSLRHDISGRLWTDMIGKPRGFTLLSVLFMITVFGISLMGANQYWRTIVKRENENELLFRGDQILKGIASYYHSSGSSGENAYPQTLEALLKDPRSMTVKRHLRRVYRDPMTQTGEWGVVRDKSGRIKGVFSKSREKPLKESGFPKEYAHFETALTYSNWRFVFDKETPD